MEGVEVRPCADGDLDVLRSRWFTSSGVHEAHHARQSEGQGTYLVAWLGDEPLGSGVVRWAGCVGPSARGAFPEAVEINHLQVRPQFRGQGVGRLLIGAAEALAAQRGRDQVAVGVSDDNPDAERLYVRLGYRATGVIDVCEYDWADDDGVTHHEVERDQILVKDTHHARGFAGRT
jgi:GNAT superfamily N-acetyltransferase